MLGLIILGIILLILLIVIVSNVKVVPQAHAYVIERLGTYHVTWSTGLHVKRVQKKQLQTVVPDNRIWQRSGLASL